MNFPILGYSAVFSAFFPFLAALFRIRYFDRESRLLFIMFSVDLCNTLIQFLLANAGIRNLFLSHFYIPFEFLFFLWIFSRWFGGASKPVLRSISVLFLLFWAASHVSLEKFTEQAFYTSLLSKILGAAVSIVFLHRISADSGQSILKDQRFWFLSGLLIFASGGILFSSLRTVIDKLPPDGLLVAYSAHWVILIVTNVFYAIGFLCKPLNSGGQLELAR